MHGPKDYLYKNTAAHLSDDLKNRLSNSLAFGNTEARDGLSRRGYSLQRQGPGFDPWHTSPQTPNMEEW